ncbi:hypothetical protein ZHAS_00007413 [Anopheles sinensis]|uniref:Uncharacterized protein n=1 Tax=Anopheles sinensis TaxID=74873 RepID=A0A084VP28_ANOSI|nr:hypothetical protein ZHAS_00007413 [Anopheles sinensis]
MKQPEEPSNPRLSSENERDGIFQQVLGSCLGTTHEDLSREIANGTASPEVVIGPDPEASVFVGLEEPMEFVAERGKKEKTRK